ncbi:MAG: hypothetical protein CMJ20_01830 [Phycisphaeraceae bacterium]|nr:hypothetical protein [Phycisphaeraceae bacterium]|tara:strand:- start:6487 stop:6963 length:477 start_codon:yes stop_codon:yes gene_type:complete
MGKLNFGKLYRDIKVAIKDYGLFVLATPSFTYSIGNSYHELPEIIVMTSRFKTAHSLINMAHEHWKRNGVTLGRNTELIQDKQGNVLPVYFQEVPLTPMIEDEIIVQAMNFYRNHPEYQKRKLTIVQMFFPDEKGLLPFEDGYNTEFEQPNLKEKTFA